MKSGKYDEAQRTANQLQRIDKDISDNFVIQEFASGASVIVDKPKPFPSFEEFKASYNILDQCTWMGENKDFNENGNIEEKEFRKDLIILDIIGLITMILFIFVFILIIKLI